jgi:hypothetical protein
MISPKLQWVSPKLDMTWLQKGERWGKMGKDGKGRQKFTCAMLGFNGINNIGIIIYCNIYDNHL